MQAPTARPALARVRRSPLALPEASEFPRPTLYLPGDGLPYQHLHPLSVQMSSCVNSLASPTDCLPTYAIPTEGAPYPIPNLMAKHRSLVLSDDRASREQCETYVPPAGAVCSCCLRCSSFIAFTSAVRTGPACEAGISNVPDGRCSLFGPNATQSTRRSPPAKVTLAMASMRICDMRCFPEGWCRFVPKDLPSLPPPSVEPDQIARPPSEYLLRLDLRRLREMLSQLHQLIEAGDLPHRHQLRIGEGQSRGLAQLEKGLIVELA